ncbi:hypothetical protein [Bacillus sp. AFS023182]|nr:hypothetical protein [Bacillus sp. AFS023182]
MAEINEMIENPNLNLVEVVKVQLESVKEHIRIQEQLYSLLRQPFPMSVI